MTVSSSSRAFLNSTGDKYWPVVCLGSTSSSKSKATISFRGRTCIFLKACPSASSILNTISLNRSSACICAIYCSVSSFVPDNVPLIPSVETRILPFKWCALQNAK